MPKGSNIKKGMRPAGRKAGTPNKRTKEALEQEQIAQQMAADVESGRVKVKKLGKDVLEEFMNVFGGLAAYYQPVPEGHATPPGRKPDENRFQIYARMAVETAHKLAPFQSPTYKAIQVIAPPPAPTSVLPPGNDNIVDDPQALARHYQQTMKLVRG